MIQLNRFDTIPDYDRQTDGQTDAFPQQIPCLYAKHRADREGDVTFEAYHR